MDKVRVGLIGIGGMGGCHYSCYEEIENAELVAVCDVRGDMAREKTAGKNVKVYEDLDEMLNSEKLDMVDICTPSYLHADMAVKCLEKGLNVLCEKPMTLTVADAERVLKAAEKSGKKFMVAHVVRFMAPYMYLKKVIENKSLGELVNLSLKRISSIPTWSWQDWMRNEKLSGGVCLDLSVHDLDFVQSVLGMPEDFSAVLRPIKDNSSFVRSELNYGKFAVSCEGTWYNADIPFSAEFLAVFDNGYVKSEGGRFVVNGEEVSLSENKFAPVEGMNISGDNGYSEEIKYFVNCVINDKSIEYVKPASSAASVALACDIISQAEII